MTTATEESTEFGLNELRTTLSGWPNIGELLAGLAPQSGLLKRIHNILKSAHSNLITDYLEDLAPLLRQLMLSNKLSISNLRIPVGHEWPDRKYWEERGFRVVESNAVFVLNPISWIPTWSDKELVEDPFEEVFAGMVCRKDNRIEADPFIKEVTGYSHYTCPGQREAIRGALLMPQGSTLVVNLPTGSGKTLVGQVPVLLGGTSAGLTLFVVPTTALAIDLERRMNSFDQSFSGSSEKHQLAWYSDLSQEAKDAIKRRIRNGTQGVLFTSPEAMTSSLRPALFDAVRGGLLGYLVVDEAHMIIQWGDSFRPAFQLIAGLRRRLLLESRGKPFRTLLLSATLSPSCIETLRVLFGPPESVQMVSSVFLRPEPKYFSKPCESFTDKIEKLAETLKHAPRPLIVYTTEKSQANKVFSWLKRVGHRRVKSFTGDTPNPQREQIIKAWVEDDVDVIVATSAFGMGVDKDDVRTIIHFQIPENLDRFYQEVGRSGRDGNASTSFAFYTDRDIRIAQSINSPDLISSENAFGRWYDMFKHADGESDGSRAIDISRVPSHLNAETDFNQAWNMRTLLLMVRSGLIELTPPDYMLPTRVGDESEEEFSKRKEDYFKANNNKMIVKTLDPLHLSPDHFERKTELARKNAFEEAKNSFDSLLAALRGSKEMANTLAKLYRGTSPNLIPVTEVCRGCPGAKTSEEEHPYGLQYYSPPMPTGINKIEIASKTSQWNSDFPLENRRLVILYPENCRDLGLLEPVLKLLVSVYGVLEVATDSPCPDIYGMDLHKYSKVNYLFHTRLDANEVLPPELPRVSVLWNTNSSRIPDTEELVSRPVFAILARENLRSHHPQRFYRDDALDWITVDRFMEVASR